LETALPAKRAVTFATIATGSAHQGDDMPAKTWLLGFLQVGEALLRGGQSFRGRAHSIQTNESKHPREDRVSRS
jgi:hypothetical protein